MSAGRGSADLPAEAAGGAWDRGRNVAIVHDYLTQRGGAERVALELARMWPDASIYTSLYRPEHTFPEFAGHRVRSSYLNRLPVRPANGKGRPPNGPRAGGATAQLSLTEAHLTSGVSLVRVCTHDALAAAVRKTWPQVVG